MNFRFAISFLLFNSLHLSSLHAEENNFTVLKREFAKTDDSPSSLTKLIVKDQIFTGTCFTKKESDEAESNILMLFAPTLPFKRQAFVSQAASDMSFDKFDTEDLAWAISSIKERSSMPLIQINGRWGWLSENGFNQSQVKFVVEAGSIKRVITRSDCTGDEATCKSYHLEVGEWQYCSYEINKVLK